MMSNIFLMIAHGDVLLVDHCLADLLAYLFMLVAQYVTLQLVPQYYACLPACLLLSSPTVMVMDSQQNAFFSKYP